MTLIGFVHKLNGFSQPDAKNGAGWRCATDHAGHYLWHEVGPTTVIRGHALLRAPGITAKCRKLTNAPPESWSAFFAKLELSNWGGL